MAHSANTQGRFFIRRNDRAVDDVLLESEGLIIGREQGAELVLNHRAVSRAHAGIARRAAIPGLRDTGLLQQLDDDNRYWLFNLSASNGTLLNGEAVDKLPLFDHDIIQIGPYLLTVQYTDANTLSLNVELGSQTGVAANQLANRTQALRTPSGRVPSGQVSTTGMLNQSTAVFAALAQSPSGQLRTGFGFLANFWPAAGQQALAVFWEKRKREAGKIESESALRPLTGRPAGKAQFNWRPTLDLVLLRRRGFLLVALLAVTLSAIVAALFYQDAYAPRPLANPHRASFTTASLQKRNLAKQENANACTTCHTPTQGMHDACIACHQTNAIKGDKGSTPAFAPQTLLEAHRGQQMGCTACHIEHAGPVPADGLLNYGLCYNCHNGAYELPYPGQSGAAAGSRLPLPHGGATGYPKLQQGQKGGEYWSLPVAQWDKTIAHWRARHPQRLLQTAAQYAALDSHKQFHLLHQGGVEGSPTLCTVCHYNEQGARDLNSEFGLHAAPKQACAKCHTTREQVTAGQIQGLANCATCHQQHGQSADLATLQPVESLIPQLVAQLAPQAATVRPFALADKTRSGPATSLRQAEMAPNWRNLGGLPWWGWLSAVGLLPVLSFGVLLALNARQRAFLRVVTQAAGKQPQPDTAAFKLTETQLRLKNEGPRFPRPVIDPQLCIGCHACVDACPHDVLAITADGVAAPVNVEQCMEDTSCQVECPTSPKACVVVHTAKVIPERKVPERNQDFMTNVPGIYLIGDVSGVPLIKNAINEGAQVIEAVGAALSQIAHKSPPDPTSYDVAIIGLGPAGLAAALAAQQRGLRYLALEQDKVAATIENTYGKGKFVFYKPDSVPVRGALPLITDAHQPGGNFKEAMLASWQAEIKRAQVQFREQERCLDIQPSAKGFLITTENTVNQAKQQYVAQQIVLAIGNRGTPMTLGVPGEQLMRRTRVLAKFCNACGARSQQQPSCPNCGKPIHGRDSEVGKVQYRLSDPAEYVGQHCIVVGAGNSAIEVAVALTGFQRNGNAYSFGAGAASVTLLVRSDLKGDLKLGNKMNFYDCVDAGKINVRYRTAIHSVERDSVVLLDAKTKQAGQRLPCETIFALIGGEKPLGFLTKLGIQVRGHSARSAKP